MSVINVGEMFYRIAREEDPASAERALIAVGRLPIRFADADWSLTRTAALIKAQYPLSYADCFAAALAARLGAAIVTGDPEFEQLEADGVVAVEWLPHRPRKRR
jgi:ribonuclease VapC